MILIGIDSGKHTGLAVWDTGRKDFRELSTLLIHQAFERVLYWDHIARAAGQTLMVVVEDARQRKWYSGNANAKQQGAGSIKRDATIWEDFLEDKHIAFRMQPPHKGLTKMTEQYFKLITGVRKRTSNHARDAAMLIWGR